MDNIKEESIVFGYIHSIETKNNLSIIIPDEIKRLIVLFYGDYIRMVFDANNIGKNLKVLKENVVRKIDEDYCWRSCVFGPEISNTFSNEFNIDIKFKKGCLMRFGFITSNIQCFDVNKGLYDNRAHCISFYVSSMNEHFELSDKNNDFVYLTNYRSKFKEGDVFRMNVNWHQNELNLYHNRIFAVKTSIYHSKKLIPVISMFYKGHKIKVKKYSFT